MYRVSSSRSTPRPLPPQWAPVSTDDGQPFDRVFVVNLARRPDRLDGFWGRGPAEWPWEMPIVHAAVDGDTVESPDSFKGPPGAWGCLQSHVAIWEMQITAGWDSVLVLEDDAIFCRDAVERMRDTLDCVPNDWDQIYFGGQHWQANKMPPEVVIQDRLIRCRNVNRTHAYAIRLPFTHAAREVVLSPFTARDVNLHHIDYRLGDMHASGQYNIYAPWRFCIGQSRGSSDVRHGRAGRSAHVSEHMWNKFPIVEPAGVA